MKLASEVVATESIKTKLYIADGMSQAGQINCFSVLSFFLANYLAFILIFFKRPFWHLFWHFMLQSMWHLFWHFFWHSIWHVFWHFIWQSLWHPIWHMSDILSSILSGILSGIFFGSSRAPLRTAWPAASGAGVQHLELAIWSSGRTASGARDMEFGPGVAHSIRN